MNHPLGFNAREKNQRVHHSHSSNDKKEGMKKTKHKKREQYGKRVGTDPVKRGGA